MSRSHGTGQPAWARCSQCRKDDSSRPFVPLRIPAGRESRMELTGRRRHRPTGRGGARVDSRHDYEYRCLDCGHVGWTRHINLSRRWRATFGLIELGRYALEITETATDPGPLHDDTDKADRLRRIIKHAVDNDLYELL